MSNVENLTPFIEGKRTRGGRKAGVLNRVTRLLKHATISAAELSKHSKDGTLQGYLTFLADEHPSLFTNLLGKMYPTMMKAELTSSFEPPRRLDPSMGLDTMVREFEAKIKNPLYFAKTIDHDDNGDDDDE